MVSSCCVLAVRLSQGKVGPAAVWTVSSDGSRPLHSSTKKTYGSNSTLSSWWTSRVSFGSCYIFVDHGGMILPCQVGWLLHSGNSIRWMDAQRGQFEGHSDGVFGTVALFYSAEVLEKSRIQKKVWSSYQNAQGNFFQSLQNLIRNFTYMALRAHLNGPQRV